ncbi:TRAP transporter substrate-binding protein DctP [Elioraea sp.]|uniref:TRAP transporter substrate-binding protein DctP n=1 Tax=Elioraea sp. TaxID=2185103 RepID=UPI0025BA7E7C|nr:TRAP transporter substrate-binding protein DctP [Elioraea sp.]
MLKRRTLLAAAPATLALPYVAPPALAQGTTLRMQHFLGTNSALHIVATQFAEDVRAATGGRVTISVLPGGAVVAPTELLDTVRNGILDGQFAAPSWFASKDAGFVILGDTGATFPSVDARDRWFSEGSGVELGRALYDRFGLYYVDQFYWPGEHIPSRRALNTVEDLRGLKVRCPPGMIAEVFGRAGASVVNLPLPELFNALQSGVVDAADQANPGLNFAVGLYRYARFSVAANHSMPTCEVSFSKRRWDGLPADARQAIGAAVKKMSAAHKAAIERDDAEALAKMRADGITIIEWPTAEIDKLAAIAAAVQDTYAPRSPQAKQILDSLRAFRARA